jgi:hypothetical protein
MQDLCPRLRITCFWMLALMMVLANGCKREDKHSELFIKIFKPEAEGTFRGVDLGMDLEAAKAKEATSPKFDDQWGYVYEFALGGKRRFFLEYISRESPSKKVTAIVVNIFLEEKAEASDLFAEVESYLRNRYGVADGTLGNLKWSDDEKNLMIALRMLDDKKSISLNYGALQAF